MNYKYRGTFVISAENTKILPGSGYEVYHCDRVRSLLDDINMKGKSMYAKIQEIRFSDEFDYSVRITEWDTQQEADKLNLGHVTNALTVEPPTEQKEFLSEYVTHWHEKLTNAWLPPAGSTTTRMSVAMTASRQVALLVYDLTPKNTDKIYIMPRHQYHVEFGQGLQAKFGLPPVVGRRGDMLLKDYSEELTSLYRDRLSKHTSDLLPNEPTYGANVGNTGYVYVESEAAYEAYKAATRAAWEKDIPIRRERDSRIKSPNVSLYVNTLPPGLTEADFDLPEMNDSTDRYQLKDYNYDVWLFDARDPHKDTLSVAPHYLYFSHADLCGNSLNLQRSTCLCEYPGGNYYDSRDEYLYVHNCSPFPKISFTSFTPRVESNGTIEYDKFLWYPMQFYIVIDYYEA